MSTLNYERISETLDIVMDSVQECYKRFAGYDIVFLARDGLIFYEAYLKLYPDQKKKAHISYISRQSLNDGKVKSKYVSQNRSGKVFSILKEKILIPAIDEVGYANIEKVIEECKNRVVAYFEDKSSDPDEVKLMENLTVELISYLEPCMKGKRVLFFDSSSTTFPVILAALCRMFYPQKEFRAYFAVTKYQDQKAGFLTHQKDNFCTDFLADIVKFNPGLSSVIPYKADFKKTTENLVALSFMTTLIMYKKFGERLS